MSDIQKPAVEGDYQAPGEFKKRGHFWTEMTADLNQHKEHHPSCLCFHCSFDRAHFPNGVL